VDVTQRVAALEKAGAERVALGLADYSARLLRRLYLRRGTAVDLDPASLTQEAIRRFLDGSWRWETDRHPVLLDFLKSRVRSLISNVLTSADYRRTAEIPRTDTGEEDMERITPTDPRDPDVSVIHPSELQPDEILLSKIDLSLVNELWRTLELRVKAIENPQLRDELTKVLSSVMAGRSYDEISADTGLARDVVYRRCYKLADLADTVLPDVLRRAEQDRGSSQS
jgi:hypothetical protein